MELKYNFLAKPGHIKNYGGSDPSSLVTSPMGWGKE
jgi:hypothetical protein